jgi:hypothetical protein
MKSSTLDSILSFLSGIIILGVCVYYFLDIRKQRKKQGGAKSDDKPSNKKYSECPDYFEIGDNGECINEKQLGSCKGTYNFDELLANYADVFRTDKQKNKLKCEWAKSCDVAWTGIDRLC